MERVSRAIRKVLNFAVFVALSGMSVLVFLNVVLRYGFNSGITWSEEMARFLFIWLTFLGAIAGLKDNEHLGVDTLIKRLPRSLKKVAYVISNLIIIYTLWLVLEGSWKMTKLSMNTRSPATNLPMSLIYGIGIVVGISMLAIVVINLYRVLFNKVTDQDLIMTKESEDQPHETVSV